MGVKQKLFADPDNHGLTLLLQAFPVTPFYHVVHNRLILNLRLLQLLNLSRMAYAVMLRQEGTLLEVKVVKEFHGQDQ